MGVALGIPWSGSVGATEVADEPLGIKTGDANAHTIHSSNESLCRQEYQTCGFTLELDGHEGIKDLSVDLAESSHLSALEFIWSS